MTINHVFFRFLQRFLFIHHDSITVHFQVAALESKLHFSRSYVPQMYLVFRLDLTLQIPIHIGSQANSSTMAAQLTWPTKFENAVGMLENMCNDLRLFHRHMYISDF